MNRKKERRKELKKKNLTICYEKVENLKSWTETEVYFLRMFFLFHNIFLLSLTPSYQCVEFWNYSQVWLFLVFGNRFLIHIFCPKIETLCPPHFISPPSQHNYMSSLLLSFLEEQEITNYCISHQIISKWDKWYTVLWPFRP